jgi:hypothetical protein
MINLTIKPKININKMDIFIVKGIKKTWVGDDIHIMSAPLKIE